ncbi:nephrin-like [Aricia agestis]|uniref:nephrin-like n=1 Tax=Aricia agestis TaxID=91739 RepID=UPI001C20222A|nr:nephrin-like [Aricia agestis]
MAPSRLHVVFCLLLFSESLEEVLIEESTNIESLHAPRGGSVELPCDVTPSLSGDSMALVIWYKQGHDAPIYSLDSRDGVTSHWSDPTTLGPRASFRTNAPAVLVLTRLRAEDSGQYRCRVDFVKSPTKNTRLNLTVLIPPDRLMILNHEGDEIRNGVLGPYDEDTDVNLTCIAIGGRPPARVSWWKSHALLANSETRASVSFPLRRADYGTNVTCQAVTDPSLAPVSETLTIDVNLHLLWVRLLGGKRPLVAGVSTELVCQAVGARPKPSISWWKGGVRLTTVRETVSPDGNVTSSILTLVPSIDDAGRVLSCRAVQPTVPHSTREDGWKLEIQHLPVVSLRLGANLDPGALVEGSDVYLDCAVRANPWHTSVHFTHNGVVVKPGPGVLVANQSLVLQRVGRRAGGAYACAARSALGQGASEPLLLDVKYSPTCNIHQPKVIRAARGETVQIECDVDANPKEPMTFTWWFNSSTHERQELPVSANMHGDMSTYTYLVNSSHSFGWVQCAGANAVGRQVTPCVFTILPAEKPAAVSSCQLGNVTVSSVTLACTPGHDGGLKQAFVLHVYDIETGVLLRNVSNDEPSFVVWGLDSNGVRLSIRAFNRQGESDPFTLTTSLLKNPQKQTAHVPVKVELSSVLVLVLCVVAVVATVTALAAVVMCLRYYNKKHDNKDKTNRKQDTTANKLLTESEDADNDKNPDIIPIESKISDTCSNMSSNTDHSVRPLIRTEKYDEPISYERYYDCNQYAERPEFRRYVGPHLQNLGPSVQSVGPGAQSVGPGVQSVGPNMPSVAYMPSGPNMTINHECMSYDKVYEDWLKYKNSLPVNTGLQFLPPSPFPPRSLYAQPRSLRLVDMPDPNRTDSPLSADTAVYYSKSVHDRASTLPHRKPKGNIISELNPGDQDTQGKSEF